MRFDALFNENPRNATLGFNAWCVWVINTFQFVAFNWLQERFQVLEHLLRRSVWRVTLNRFAALVDDELGEVPLDGVEQQAALFLLQILPQWMCAFAIHVNLFEQVKLNFAIASEALNFLSVARLLVVELIARERENAQTYDKWGRNIGLQSHSHSAIQIQAQVKAEISREVCKLRHI